MNSKRKKLLAMSMVMTLLSGLFVGCVQKGAEKPSLQEESREAKALLQGVWVDADTEVLSFYAAGDSLFYPDSTSQPSHFMIVGDSLVLGRQQQKYPIVKQTEHVFWFKNQNGDLIKLIKSDNPDAEREFVHDEPPKVLTYTEVVKTDSVIIYDGERYHWYLAINPTKYRVMKTSYNDNGMEVDNVYYDNIMHISIFHGAQKIFSRDFRKQMYTEMIPVRFLEQAVLANMQYSKTDQHGFHFDATICIPDGASCYRVENVISLKGELSTKLLEY